MAVLEDRILSGAKALLLTTNFVQIATNDFKENMLPKAPVIGLFDEETEAERYVLNKKMTCPPISYFSIGIHTFIFLYSVIGLNFLIFCLSLFWTVISSKNCSFLTSDNPVASCIVVTMISLFITLLIFSKRILIGLVHVYQRYAPEARRRMCLFKPTCSEYAILALNKYGSIRGTIKTIDRLKRCKGGKYHIDYP